MFLGLPAMAWRSLTESNCLGRELTQVAVSWQDLTFDSNHLKKKKDREMISKPGNCVKRVEGGERIPAQEN